MLYTESQGLAIAASNLVKVNYINVQTPILTIEEAIAAGSYFPKPGFDVVRGNAEGKGRPI